MRLEKKMFRKYLLPALLITAFALAAQARAQQVQNPLLPENATKKVSDHVYVIMGFPNVGIVVGNRATLVVDSGLGPRNGATVAREAAKLAQNPILYLTTTHFHPEHASGDSGFPAGTILIRPAVQQQELEKNGMSMVELFRKNPQFAPFLTDVKFRAPDIVFDKEATLDLGGVTVRLTWMGTAHTLGDELIYVEQDKTLLPGDVVQNKLIPNLFGPDARLNNWIKILGELKTLAPRYIVPDHGALGDGSLIGQDYAFFSDLQSRSLELKRQGKSADEAGKTVAAEFKTKYPDWPQNGIAGVVAHVYSENP